MSNPWQLCIAPMLDWTDRHYRCFMRQITPHARLYTEMVTTGALLHGNAERFLRHDPAEQPLAIQLGGSDPQALADCAILAEQQGYAEINLNVGCPSDRVQAGRFGACLMAEPDLVARCVAAMQAVVSIPVTVKTRIGIDEQESYALFKYFIETVAAAGCHVFIIHARKAWLQGLSPKQNRDVPPLNYPWVYQLKQERPDLCMVINGGIQTLAAVKEHLTHVDGVMLGRIAYHEPYLFASLEHALFQYSSPSRQAVMQALIPYIQQQLATGARLNNITRHLLNLFNGQPGAKAWRRYLSQHAHLAGADAGVVQQALAMMDQNTCDLALSR